MRGLMMKSKDFSAAVWDSFRQVHTTACPNRQRIRLRTVCGCNKCRLNSSFQLAFLIWGVEPL